MPDPGVAAPPDLGSLADRAGRLRAVERELRDGSLLRPLFVRAQDNAVWEGSVRVAFVGWLRSVDAWLRTPLADGVGVVAGWIEGRTRAIEEASKQMAAGLVPPPLPPPAPLRHAVPAPPDFRLEMTQGPGRISMDPEQMRNLANLVGRTGGAVMEFGNRIREQTGDPGAPIPGLPHDAAEAAGFPGAFQRLSQALGTAAADLVRRAQAIAGEAIAGPGVDVAGMAAAVPVHGGVVKGVKPKLGPSLPARTLEELEQVRRAAAGAAEKVGDLTGDPDFNRKHHAKLFEVLTEAENHVDDPDYAAAFVERFVDDGLRPWCKLMNNSVINLQVEADILRPMSKLIGSATQAGDGLSPKTRKALLDSRCLDTLVHYGTYDSEFALLAARRILEDPDRYERSDNTDRVYSQRKRGGGWEHADARLGAFRLLVNNPEAARTMAEQKGEGGRRLLFEGLEADGLVGDAAGAALEVGLSDLSRDASENTLEVIIKKVDAGEIDLEGPGKAALARLLSSEEMVKTLALRTTESEGGDLGQVSDVEGFGVTASTLEGAFGKILDDEAARAEFLSRLWAESSLILKAEAAAYVPGTGSPVAGVVRELGHLGNLYQTVVEGAHGASDEKKANLYAVAGLKKALDASVKLIPGVGVIATVAETAVKAQGEDWIDDFLSAAEKKRIETLDADGLAQELEKYLRPLAAIAIFSNPDLVKQLLPPGSAEAGRFAAWIEYDASGNPIVRIPPPGKGEEQKKDPASWGQFVRTLVKEADTEPTSGLGEAVKDIDDKVEMFKPRRG